MNKVIRVENLSKTFSVKDKEPGLSGSIKAIFAPKKKNIEAVKNISFEVTEGEMIGFIGPNGAGKTTTLKMLSGILFPTSGNIDVLNFQPYERKNEFLKQISLVMGQKNQLIWDLPPIDTFYLNKETYEIPDENYKNVLEELVDLFDIGDILKQQVRRLSLGQRMKCELVASLLHTPKILFLDEPTIGLDILIQKKLRQFIKEFNKKFGTTVILTSHYMDDVKEITNRIIIINQGEMAFDNSLKELSRAYANYKTLALTLNKNVPEEKVMSLGEVVSFEYPKLILKVQPELIAETTAKALSVLDVDDIDIAEPKLEDIVAKIFEKK